MNKLIIDADILAYKVSFSAEHKVRWDDGIWSWYANESEAIQKCCEWITNIHKHLDADLSKSLFCFTGNTNWRHGIMPEYKAHRGDTRTPLVLNAVRDYLMSTYKCAMEEPFEADDLMGIYSQKDPEAIVVSLDKDLKQIPGYKCRDVGSPVFVVSPIEGFRWHMRQTLTGDATDGYSGCPGVGPVKAEKCLANLMDPAEMWAKVVKEYAKAGLPEAEALRQARVAKILQSSLPSERLWNPPNGRQE
jgi:DNA polymerase-1